MTDFLKQLDEGLIECREFKIECEKHEIEILPFDLDEFEREVEEENINWKAWKKRS